MIMTLHEVGESSRREYEFQAGGASVTISGTVKINCTLDAAGDVLGRLRDAFSTTSAEAAATAGTSSATSAATGTSAPASTGTSPATSGASSAAASAAPAGASPGASTSAGTSGTSATASTATSPATSGASSAAASGTTASSMSSLTPDKAAEWFETTYHSGTVPSPTGQMKELQVVSWMQVPHILQELQKSDKQIRITFPEPTPADPARSAEQVAIRKFLVDNASKEMKAIAAQVTAEIEKCQLFTSGLVVGKAADYVAHFTLDSTNSDQLTVAEVIRTDKHFQPTKSKGLNNRPAAVKGRDVILSAVEDGVKVRPTDEFRSYVIEVVETHDSVAKKTLGDRYNSWPNPKPDLQYVKVWVCPDFTSPSATVAEFDLLSYIGGSAGGSPGSVHAGRRRRTRTP